MSASGGRCPLKRVLASATDLEVLIAARRSCSLCQPGQAALGTMLSAGVQSLTQLQLDCTCWPAFKTTSAASLTLPNLADLANSTREPALGVPQVQRGDQRVQRGIGAESQLLTGAGAEGEGV